MSFLNTLTTLGTPTISMHLSSRAADPIQRARENFVRVATKQLSVLKQSKFNRKGSWFTKQSDGTFNVSLRAGTSAMKLVGDSTHLNVDSIDKVQTVFEQAIAAVKNGELDDKFAEHASTDDTDAK